MLKLFLNKISEEWKELIDKDEDNKNLWAQVKTKEAGNKKELQAKKRNMNSKCIKDPNEGVLV